MEQAPSLLPGFPGCHHYLWARPTPEHASSWLFRFRIIPPLLTWTGPNPASVRRDQASPDHAAPCPTMPPALTTDPPWSSPGTPSSAQRKVESPGVCADRFARPRRPRLRPGRLSRVRQIPPRGGHPTLLDYGPYPAGPAGPSPAREQHCRAHVTHLPKRVQSFKNSRVSIPS
jgi:hypothetical protein